MSELVETEFGKLDLDLMEHVARQLGYSTQHDMVVSGNTNAKVKDGRCQLVAIKNGTQIGFQHRANGKTACVYDNWTKAPKECLKELMPTYTEQLTLRRAHVAGFRSLGRTETQNEIVIRLGRAR